MKSKFAILAVLATTAAPAFAAGDAAKGEAAFKQCQTCHVVVDDAGNTLAGRNSKTGPNLYGVIGRAAGSLEGFKYGESIIAVGAAGYAWDEAGFVEYVQDPAAFLKAKLDDKGAKSKMSFKVKNAETAADLYAFLAQFGAAPAADAAAEGAAAEGAEAPADGTETTTQP
ncbi:c-type cytochrome [Tabrizicola sp.]|uniref:c-type cytochrome n=1 Tax=Tabrizicola sp. TaxID=2005166 RepID=UPI003D2E4A2F